VAFPWKLAGQGELGNLVNNFFGRKKEEFVMKQYKVALLRKEFPFLDRLFVDSEGRTSLCPENVNDIKVKKGDKALLIKRGFEDSYDWSGGGHCDYTKYFAVCGEAILELETAGYSGTGSGKMYEWDADTLGEQLFAKRITPDYIVECVRNDTDDNGNGEVTNFWIIYKTRRFDLANYHQQQIDRAAAALKAEIKAACC